MSPSNKCNHLLFKYNQRHNERNIFNHSTDIEQKSSKIVYYLKSKTNIDVFLKTICVEYYNLLKQVLYSKVSKNVFKHLSNYILSSKALSGFLPSFNSRNIQETNKYFHDCKTYSISDHWMSKKNIDKKKFNYSNSKCHEIEKTISISSILSKEIYNEPYVFDYDNENILFSFPYVRNVTPKENDFGFFAGDTNSSVEFYKSCQSTNSENKKILRDCVNNFNESYWLKVKDIYEQFLYINKSSNTSNKRSSLFTDSIDENLEVVPSIDNVSITNTVYKKMNYVESSVLEEKSSLSSTNSYIYSIFDQLYLIYSTSNNKFNYESNILVNNKNVKQKTTKEKNKNDIFKLKESRVNKTSLKFKIENEYKIDSKDYIFNKDCKLDVPETDINSNFNIINNKDFYINKQQSSLSLKFKEKNILDSNMIQISNGVSNNKSTSFECLPDSFIKKINKNFRNRDMNIEIINEAISSNYNSFSQVDEYNPVRYHMWNSKLQSFKKQLLKISDRTIKLKNGVIVKPTPSHQKNKYEPEKSVLKKNRFINKQYMAKINNSNRTQISKEKRDSTAFMIQQSHYKKDFIYAGDSKNKDIQNNHVKGISKIFHSIKNVSNNFYNNSSRSQSSENSSNIYSVKRNISKKQETNKSTNSNTDSSVDVSNLILKKTSDVKYSNISNEIWCKSIEVNSESPVAQLNGSLYISTSDDSGAACIIASDDVNSTSFSPVIYNTISSNVSTSKTIQPSSNTNESIIRHNTSKKFRPLTPYTIFKENTTEESRSCSSYEPKNMYKRENMSYQKLTVEENIDSEKSMKKSKKSKFQNLQRFHDKLRSTKPDIYSESSQSSNVSKQDILTPYCDQQIPDTQQIENRLQYNKGTSSAKKSKISQIISRGTDIRSSIIKVFQPSSSTLVLNSEKDKSLNSNSDTNECDFNEKETRRLKSNNIKLYNTKNRISSISVKLENKNDEQPIANNQSIFDNQNLDPQHNYNFIQTINKSVIDKYDKDENLSNIEKQIMLKSISENKNYNQSIITNGNCKNNIKQPKVISKDELISPQIYADFKTEKTDNSKIAIDIKKYKQKPITTTPIDLFDSKNLNKNFQVISSISNNKNITEYHNLNNSNISTSDTISKSQKLDVKLSFIESNLDYQYKNTTEINSNNKSFQKDQYGGKNIEITNLKPTTVFKNHKSNNLKEAESGIDSSNINNDSEELNHLVKYSNSVIISNQKVNDKLKPSCIENTDIKENRVSNNIKHITLKPKEVCNSRTSKVINKEIIETNAETQHKSRKPTSISKESDSPTKSNDKPYVLGKGYSGNVYLAKDSRNILHAIKEIEKKGLSDRKLALLYGELNIYVLLDHPHICRLIDLYETTSSVTFIMEHCSGRELYGHLRESGKLEESQVKHLLYQMLTAINYIHSLNIAHRDLKLENWLFSDRSRTELKLIDFGFAAFCPGQTRLSRPCGSMAYIAPDVLAQSYNTKCDVWSLGVISFMLLSGYAPFQGTDKEMMDDISKGRLRWRPSRWTGISNNGRQFVSSLLTVNPAKRPTAREALLSGWLTCPSIVKELSTIGISVDTIVQILLKYIHVPQFTRHCLVLCSGRYPGKALHPVAGRLFQTLCSGCDGYICFSDVMGIMENMLPHDYISKLYTSIDVNGDTILSYSEFSAAVLHRKLRRYQPALKSVFNYLSKGKNEIPISTIKAFDSSSNELQNELILKLDPNKTNTVTFSQFCQTIETYDLASEKK